MCDARKRVSEARHASDNNHADSIACEQVTIVERSAWMTRCDPKVASSASKDSVE